MTTAIARPVDLLGLKTGRPKLGPDALEQRRQSRMRRIRENIAHAEVKIANQQMRIANWRDELASLERGEK